MEISSLVVHAAPGRFNEVAAALACIDGVELHANDGSGRIVLTIEDGEGYRVEDSITRLQQLAGVMSVALVYQYCDDGLQTSEASDGHESA